MYNSYFGFQESPFSVTPDPGFFYTNSVYLEVYANLRYGIEGKKGFISITGEVGIGKTTLLRKLMRNLESSTHCVLVFNTDLTFTELLRVILAELCLSTEGKDRLAMLEELNRYLIEQFEKGDLVCLLIDEAQHLSDETLEALRLLSNLETDKQKLLQIVLVGQPELNARLEQPKLRQLNQRIAIRCEITPLSDREVDSYIKFRLQAVGYRGKALFDTDAVQKIALYSKGIPRLINIVCDNALLIAYAASKKIVSAHIISEVAGDLRLPSRKGDHPSAVVGSAVKEKRATAHRSSRNTGRVLKVLGGMFTAILVIAVLVAVRDPQSFLTSTQKTVAQIEHTVNERALLDSQKTVPPKADAEASEAKPQAREQTNEAKIQPKDHRIVVRYGSTIYQIASEEYGDNVMLGMDLIKEFNAEIKDLNWVAAGQELVLPSITRETLVRHQPDNSYRILVGSFLTRKRADEFARAIDDWGHQVVVTPNRVSNDLVLYRLEIDRLTTREEATQALEGGLRRGWFPLAERPGTMGLRNADNTY